MTTAGKGPITDEKAPVTYRWRHKDQRRRPTTTRLGQEEGATVKQWSSKLCTFLRYLHDLIATKNLTTKDEAKLCEVKDNLYKPSTKDPGSHEPSTRDHLYR
ncbi:hypothetical protein MTR_8g469700 [Medicago truncatula]|uniref:Uncharacterized protein n=1 Tax=Medicago truncatula TaxID=3880 RepID=A0A072TSS4_MEDTR|nr:hypothetical protein MTR_8g469700 [Medicago truncatula]